MITRSRLSLGHLSSLLFSLLCLELCSSPQAYGRLNDSLSGVEQNAEKENRSKRHRRGKPISLPPLKLLHSRDKTDYFTKLLHSIKIGEQAIEQLSPPSQNNQCGNLANLPLEVQLEDIALIEKDAESHASDIDFTQHIISLINGKSKPIRLEGGVLQYNFPPDDVLDKAVQVKVHSADSYNGISTKDFEDRINLIEEGILSGGIEDLLNIKDAELSPETLKDIKDLSRAAILDINQFASIDIGLAKQDMKDEAEIVSLESEIKQAKAQLKLEDPENKIRLEKLIQGQEKALKKLQAEKSNHPLTQAKVARTLTQTYVTKLLKLLEKNTPKSIQLRGKDLNKLENAYITQKGRPTLFHLYETDVIEPKGLKQSKFKFVSSQVPISDKAIGSNGMSPQGYALQRNSASRRGEGLANAVKSVFQTVDQSNGTVKTEFQAYRHSAYNPILISSYLDLTNKVGFERQRLAHENVKKMITNLVEDHIAQYGVKTKEGAEACTEANPLEIPLTTMMLVTPALGDKVYRGNESEVRQLEESYLALRSMHGVSTQVDGCFVRLKSSLMNMGTNAADATFSAIRTSSADRINAKGFVEFDTSARHFIKEKSQILNHLQNLSSDDEKKLSQEIQSDLSSLSLLNDLNHNDGQYGEYQSLNENAHHLNKELSEKYALLREHYKNNNAAEGIKLSQQITELETNYQKQYLRMQEILKSHYVSNQKAIRDTENQVIDKLGKLLNTKKLSTTERSQLETLRNVIRTTGDAKHVFHNEVHNTWGPDKTEFQKSFLIANYLMSSTVEFFCKSAEDRTGRVNVKIEAAMIYKSRYGEFPRYDDPKAKATMAMITNDIASKNASLENTRMNNPGSGGIQVSADDEFTSGAKVGKFQAGAAKQSYKGLGLKSRFHLRNTPLRMDNVVQGR